MTATYISRDAGLSDRNFSGDPACSCPEKTGRSGERKQRQLLPTDRRRPPLSGIIGMTFPAPAPMPARRSDLTVVGSDELSLLDDLRLRRFQHIERRRRGPSDRVSAG
jgi:hypothetical protein